MLTPKSFIEIYNDLVSYIVGHTSQITQFNAGGVVRTALEATAVKIEAIYTDLYLAFRNMSMDGIYELFGFTRKGALKGSVNVVFSSNSPVPVATDIPVGTILESSTGVQFETIALATIPLAGTSSNSVAARALVAGELTIGVGEVNRMVTAVGGVDSVTNAAVPTDTGRNGETDTEMLERFQTYIQGLSRCGKYGIESGAEKVAGVKQAQLVESVTLGISTLYVDDGTGSASPALLSDVQDIIEGDGTAENQGYRAAGTIILYSAPTKITVNVTQSLWFRAGTDIPASILKVETVEAAYINALTMGADAVLEQIKADAIKKVPELVDIVFTLPAANVSVNDGQIAKAGTFTSTGNIWTGD